MKTINASIEGTAPLLQHKMSVEEEAKIESKTRKQAGARNEENPQDYLYLINGKICQPAEHIRSAIVKRLSSYKISGKGKKTYKELGQGAIEVSPEYIEHEIQDWKVDSRTVVIPATRGRAVRKRPRLDKWKLNFQIQILNDEMPAEIIKLALDDAGREGGLGDYRPRFGRFIVTSWKETNT